MREETARRVTMRWAVARTTARAGVQIALVRLAGEITAVPTVATAVAMGAGMLLSLWTTTARKSRSPEGWLCTV